MKGKRVIYIRARLCSAVKTGSADNVENQALPPPTGNSFLRNQGKVGSFSYFCSWKDSCTKHGTLSYAENIYTFHDFSTEKSPHKRARNNINLSLILYIQKYGFSATHFMPLFGRFVVVLSVSENHGGHQTERLRSGYTWSF